MEFYLQIPGYVCYSLKGAEFFSPQLDLGRMIKGWVVIGGGERGVNTSF